MTHTSSCLTFNQRGSSLSLSLSLLFAQLCHAHTMTAALIGFSLLRQRPTTATTTTTTQNDTTKTRIAIFDRRLSLGFILRYFAPSSLALVGFFLATSSLLFFFVPALAFLCNWRSARALARLLFLRNKVYISHIHHFWQLQLIVCNVGQMDGPV